MTHEKVSSLLARFEENHAVETYCVEGVHVWPLMRMMLGMRLVMRDGASAAGSGNAGAKTKKLYVRSRGQALRVFRKGRNVYRDLAAGLPPALQRKNHWPEREGGFPAAIVTNADRAVSWGDAWIHSVVDPLVETLEEQDLASCVWERGRSPGPRRHRPTRISELHKHAYNRASKQTPNTLNPPEGFDAFSRWMQEDLGLKIAWHEFEATIRHVLVLSRVFEAWMERAGCRFVFLDCWFTAHSLAAALAAHRRGIPAVDFQHGVHGEANVGYNFWTHAPEAGYAMMPSHFWVWGADEADSLLKDNAPSVVDAGKVLTGGNLWINQWRARRDPLMRQRSEEAAALAHGFSKTVLITLQNPVIVPPDWLPQAIRESPRDWRWLVRIHRRDTGSREALARPFLETGHPGLEIERATSLPLYALFQSCDAHITGYSSCALEALAFGIPSLLTHPSGDSVYRRYLEAGVMQRCDDAGELLSRLREGPDNGSDDRAERIREASERAFAPDAAATEAVNRLKAIAGIAD